MQPLFTLAEFKEHEGIAGAADDARITSLALRVTRLCESICNRSFADETVTELYDGDGTEDLWLKRPPVTSVTSVTVDGDLLPADEYLVEKGTGCLRLVDGASVGDILGTSALWPTGKLNVQVVYRGGFAVVPEDLKETAILWASQLFNVARNRSGGVLSRTIGDFSETFVQGSANNAASPDWVRKALRTYILPRLRRRTSTP